ncbi:MAG: tetratricopeptide repeat protein [Bacteroidota bacterium]
MTPCRIAIAFFFLLFSKWSTASTSVDSLLYQLSLAKEDTNKVNLLNQIGFSMYTIDVRQTLTYGEQALQLAQKLQFGKGIACAYNVLGIGHCCQGNSQKALEYFLKCAQIAEELQIKEIAHKPTNNIGLIYHQWRNMAKALSYYRKAIDLAKQSNNPTALSVYLSNVGDIYFEQKQFDTALDYYQRARYLRDSIQTKLYKAELLRQIGSVYAMTQQSEKALTTYKQAQQIALESNDKMAQAQLHNSIGTLHLRQQKPDQALTAFQKALDIAQKIDNQTLVSDYFLSLSQLYLQTDDFQTALIYNNKNMLLSEGADNRKNLEKIYEIYAAGYEGLGDFQTALYYHKKFKEESDSLFNGEQAEFLAKAQSQIEIEKKIAENDLLRLQQRKNEMMIRERGYLIIAIAVILLLVSYLAFVLSRINQRRKIYSSNLKKEVERQTKDIERSHKMLKESYEELERFAYIASHDLKEPLRNISSFSKLIERRLGHFNDIKLKEYLSFIQDNTKQMNTLIVDVLEYSKIRNKSLLYQEVDLNDLLSQVAKSLQSSLRERHANIVATDLPTVRANSSQLFLVFKNLISNGIKYNQSMIPKVVITYELMDGEYFFYVKDNGIGIPEEFHQQIFVMFKRLHTRQTYKGSGLGLAISKKAIHQMNGSIWVESEEGQGSKFIFTLPAEERHLQNREGVLKSFDLEAQAIENMI